MLARRTRGVPSRAVARELGLTHHAVRRLEREAIARLRVLLNKR